MAPGAQAWCTLLRGTPTARLPSRGSSLTTPAVFMALRNGGGPRLFGTVYKLTPSAGGQWTETILYGFQGPRMGSPQTGVILDSDGNLYGTTPIGGIAPDRELAFQRSTNSSRETGIRVVKIQPGDSCRRGRSCQVARRPRAFPRRESTRWWGFHRRSRSEEHTSELQSLRHLVCRLLL